MEPEIIALPCEAEYEIGNTVYIVSPVYREGGESLTEIVARILVRETAKKFVIAKS